MSTSVSRTKSPISAAAPASTVTRPATSGRTFNIVAGIVLVVFAIVWLIPSLFALKTSLVENGTASLGASAILKDFNPTLHSYASLFNAGYIWNWYLASGITSVITAALTVFFASMA